MMQYKQLAREFLRQHVISFRKVKNLTQEKMAERLRITIRAYADIEHGRYSLSSSTLLFLLVMLDETELNDLLEEFRGAVEEYESAMPEERAALTPAGPYFRSSGLQAFLDQSKQDHNIEELFRSF